jgi:hypothetical protein
MTHDWHPGRARQWTFYTHSLPKEQWSVTEFSHAVTLDWAKRPSTEAWNEICAWTIEHFGLPGHRYQTEVGTEKMTWYFQNQQDQMIMTIAWGDDTQG